MKTIGILIAITVLLLVGGTLWSKNLAKNDPDIIATGGLHWHPRLTMYVKGEQIEIPENIGIGAVHQPMHTHDDLPVIHLEFGGLVREKDTMLGEFFKNWGKDMHSFGSNMHMTVNWKENTEYENYPMKDGDVIELRYD